MKITISIVFHILLKQTKGKIDPELYVYYSK